tara:strand:+ start:1342 stop:2994 length:1653 start_codon:yes stop_codon:yes gene_type:complete
MFIRSIKNIFRFSATKSLFIIFLIIINTLLEVLSIGTIIPLISLFLKSEIYQVNFILNFTLTFNKVLLLFIIFIIFKNLTLIYYSYCINNLVAQYKSYLSISIFKKINSQDYLFFSKNKTSDLFQSINDDPLIYTQQGIKSSLMLLADIIVSVFIVLILFFINFKISLSIFGSISLIFLLSYLFFKKYSTNLGNIRRKTNIQLINFINKTLNSIKEIKVYGSINFFNNKLEKNTIDNSNSLATFAWIQSLPKSIFEIFIIILVILNVYIMKQNSSIEELINYVGVFIFISLRLAPNINRSFTYIQSMKFAKSFEEKIINNMKLKTISFNNINNSKYELSSDIILKNINLTIDEKKILENFNFVFKKHSFNGIFGPSGSGKSKLIEIIIGLIKPNSGKIFFGKKVYENVSENIFSKVGYCAHTSPMINDTIENNILFGRAKIKNHETVINKLFDISGLNSLISSFPEGKNYILNELENNLSSGQKQRIAICRALYYEHDLIIFDESTNALDEESELKILNNIKKNFNQTTFIIISHSKRVMDYCSNICKLK